MKITPKTKFVTNGSVFIKLGSFSESDPPKQGHIGGCWWWCTCWPHYHKTQEVRFLHGLEKNGMGRVPFGWLVSDNYPPFMPGFIGIKRKLIPPAILAKLES